ncbi:M1 family metallopeptidase [Mucilaginibacter robiniae]|uniref:Aminopeptidase N n=1 Tax=Mucilaginibacter robiniae TaxID=2728022 RepID=A0A7L5E1K0_9SPHI|nr:M1 family metallopeptidase [Mucilaginibacter robiniae]QJD96277.1 M1 family metallopeptidase [Mucilaginibacter robiniae]
MRAARFYCFLVTLICFSQAQAQSLNSFFDVLHYRYALQLNDANNSIKGQATITLKTLNDKASIALDLVKKNSTGKGMLVSGVKENGKTIKFMQDSDQLLLYTSVKRQTTHTYTITYEGIPADGLIISTNKYHHRTFFGDNWPNRTHNWLPCADYPSDKATVEFFVTAPNHYQVVANGLKVKETLLPHQLKLTHWNEKVPVPPYVMVIGVANFAINQSGTVNGIPVYSYVFPEEAKTGFQDYAMAKEILPFYIQHIGPYAYEKLANVQSKTIFGGMENASAIFYFENSVGDRDVESLLAHEIAHQWFGDAVTEKTWPHLWLSEGFATYLTDCYLESKYGADTLNKRLIQERNKIFAFEKRRFTPVIDTTVTRNYTQLLNANSYEKGSWIIHMMRRQMGDQHFWSGLRRYYVRYKNGNATSNDLWQIMETESRRDLTPIFKQWLTQPGHPQLAFNWHYDEAKKQLQIKITQQQKNLFSFPLDYLVDGQFQQVDVKDRETTILLPLDKKAYKVVADPYVNLLGEVEIKEM